MKILVNCSNLRFGGGKTVGVNIIRQLVTRPENNYVFVVPDDLAYQEFVTNKEINTIVVHKAFTKILFKPLLNANYLTNMVKRIAPDLVISLGNVAIPTKTKQILLIHLPYFAYRDSVIWKLLPTKFLYYIKLMIFQIRRNLKYTDMILVQTNSMLTRIAQHYNLPIEKFRILPNAVNLTGMKAIKDLDFDTIANQPIKLLLLSKYYPHKNFEILLPLATRIKENGWDIKISITLSAKESVATAAFLEKLKDMDLEDTIVNIGDVSFENIPQVYEAHHGLILPTLLESFSGTYIEAMYYGRPIFTTDIDFAKEVCKDAAYYFDPFNDADILDTIQGAFALPAGMHEKVEKGKTYCNEYKDWNEIGSDLKKYINELTTLMTS